MFVLEMAPAVVLSRHEQTEEALESERAKGKKNEPSAAALKKRFHDEILVVKNQRGGEGLCRDF